MEVTITKFKARCLELIDEVYQTHEEIIITRKGKPLAKLSYVAEDEPDEYIGSLVGVGCTVGDLTEPLADNWEMNQ